LTGAEIGAWVNEALVRAFDRRERGTSEPQADLDIEDFLAVVQHTVPLARMRREEIQQMREWSSQHAVAASSPSSATQDVIVEGRRLSL